MCPIRPLARISRLTPSSQAKKSDLEVRTGICETVGKVLGRGGTDEGGVVRGKCTGIKF